MTTTLAPPTVHPCAATNLEYGARAAIELDTAAAELRTLADWLADATVTELADRYAPNITIEQLDTQTFDVPALLAADPEHSGLGVVGASLRARYGERGGPSPFDPDPPPAPVRYTQPDRDGWTPSRSDEQRRRDTAVLAELGNPDAMTAYMAAGSSSDLPGTVVGTNPTPADEPRRVRWARTAGDILAWIGGRT